MRRKMVDIRSSIPKHKTKKWKKRGKIDKIVIHCTASTQQDPNKVAQYHIAPNHISSTGCPSLCYHDFIDNQGVIYHCNNYEDSTWHASLFNESSIGVVIAFEGKDKIIPPITQYDALVKHLVALCLYIKILPENILGHREVPGMFTIFGKGSKKFKKACPGMGVDLDYLRQAVTTKLQQRLKDEGLYYGAIDGLFGPKSRSALNNFVPSSKLLGSVK
jgi:N-acetyl-anhydromuramyl-L-alanine amidase AmpD